MRHGYAFALVSLSIAIVALGGCGSDTPTHTTNPTPLPTVAPTPTPTPTPTGIVLPPGMTCSPTPPPLHSLHIGIFSDDGGGRVILDSKPEVTNVDDYCHRVGLGSGAFCNTRPEGDLERVACDYLATGKATDTGRWGPTWFGEGKPCGAEFSNCVNHPTEQFKVIVKDKGEFKACVAEDAPVAADGERCAIFGYY